MNVPLVRIPGASAPNAAPAAPAAPARTVGEVLAQSQVEDVIAELDRELVGLAPVKQRIRDIAALLVMISVPGDTSEFASTSRLLLALGLL